jgi:hypothetical protein
MMLTVSVQRSVEVETVDSVVTALAAPVDPSLEDDARRRTADDLDAVGHRHHPRDGDRDDRRRVRDLVPGIHGHGDRDVPALRDGQHARRPQVRRDLVGRAADLRDAHLLVDQGDSDADRDRDERDDDEHLDHTEAVFFHVDRPLTVRVKT